jgi:hypothetical protein
VYRLRRGSEVEELIFITKYGPCDPSTIAAVLAVFAVSKYDLYVSFTPSKRICCVVLSRCRFVEGALVLVPPSTFPIIKRDSRNSQAGTLRGYSAGK